MAAALTYKGRAFEDIILSVDTSDTGGTYSVLGFQGTDELYDLLESGDIEVSDLSKARSQIQQLWERICPSLVAVETIAGYISQARIKRTNNVYNLDLQDLCNAGFWSGFFVACMPDPKQVFCLPANNKPGKPSWRLYLTRNYRAGNKEVAHSLNFWLRGGIPVRSKSLKTGITTYKVNDHVRDASGLGVIAHRMLRGKK